MTMYCINYMLSSDPAENARRLLAVQSPFEEWEWAPGPEVWVNWKLRQAVRP